MKNVKEKNSLHLYELNCLVGLSSSEQVSDLAKKIVGWIENKKGELIEVEKKETPESKGGKSEVWIEKKRLAYPIGNDKAGYYINSWLKLDPSEVDNFRRFLKLEKEVIRYAILAEDKISGPRLNRDAVELSQIGQLASQQPSSKPPIGKSETRDEIPAVPVLEVNKEKLESKIEKKEVKIAPETKAEPVAEIEKEVVEEKIVQEEIKPEEQQSEVSKQARHGDDAMVQNDKKEEIKEEKPVEIKEEIKEKPAEKAEDSKEKVEKEEKTAKRKKITLEELDKRLDDILNEDIL